jgi:hypothetical protein
VPIYKWIHQPHHHYKRPTAFCAQAITGLEGVYFAATSSLIQCGLGSFMLIWSILAHDSDGRLDGGFHYEHHNHPDTNLGFLGFMDVLCDTMWLGEKLDCRGPKCDSGPMYPQYRHGYLGRLHEFLQDRYSRVDHNDKRGPAVVGESLHSGLTNTRTYTHRTLASDMTNKFIQCFAASVSV